MRRTNIDLSNFKLRKTSTSSQNSLSKRKFSIANIGTMLTALRTNFSNLLNINPDLKRKIEEEVVRGEDQIYY